MVVAEVVRIRNFTTRTFHLQVSDYFHTPLVDGKPLIDGALEVPPGFDATASGLTVPWETTTSTGLAISEGDHKIRCVLAPETTIGCESDWIQFRSDGWEPLLRARWVAVGRRHWFGAVGTTLEWQLTFRDANNMVPTSPGQSESESALGELVHFEQAVLSAARNTVFLNVYDLTRDVSFTNAALCNKSMSGLGAFHTAVEVYGEEWSFYRTPDPVDSGVCRSGRARQHPVHIYRQSLDMGTTSLADWEVRYLIQSKLAEQWSGGAYNILRKNCIHFCDELLLNLGVDRAPGWVTGLHETGAALFGYSGLPWPLSLMFGGDSADDELCLEDELVAA
eukprot:TRINITY_DN9023_c0_g1_i1.p1 TRINITY_DN9023_c0_g1~~TRINITY_DN9023_c0_g1_i1.p1  ORF type:complete len:336 (+),score=58.93 TRINITY_DN9023_c0_g1_i1:175-1182(+)